MKLTQFNMRIFIQELDDLSQLSTRVINQGNAWLEGQERRDKGWGFDQYRMQSIRIALEDLLNQYREKSATVYDFQGDRGMADFAPAGFNNGNEEEGEEEEEEDDHWVDLIFPKEEKMGTAMLIYDPSFWSRFYQPLIAS